MDSDFATAMRRALASVRSQDLGEATAIIQHALRGRTVPDGGDHGGQRGPGEDAATLRPLPQFERPHPRFRGRRLSEVLAGLRRGRSQSATPPPELPEGAQFLARTFRCQAGERSYRLYVPACAAQGLHGLVLMLHGCTQTPEDFARGTRMNAVAEANRLLVVYPAQSRSANASGCWNWFVPDHQKRDAGEPAILAGLTREIAREFDIPLERTFIAGLSAGGAMAVVLAETYPELYAAAGIHSGLPYASAHDANSAFAAMRGQAVGRPIDVRAPASVQPRLIVFHGSDDRTVHPSNGERIAATAEDFAPKVEQGQAPGGRGYSRRVSARRDGRSQIEFWRIEGAGHAWAGGDASGSYTDPEGPDASREMVRFFLS